MNMKLEELQPPTKKKNKVFFILLGTIVVIFIIIFAYFKILTREPDITSVKTDPATQAAERTKNTGIQTDSPAYLKAAKEDDVRRAREAEQSGRSSTPRLITDKGEPSVFGEIPPKEAPVEEPVKEPQVVTSPPPPPATYQYQPSPQQTQATGSLDHWMGGADFQPGRLEVRRVENRVENSPNVKIPDKDTVDAGARAEIAAGTMMYAIMDIGANSDQPDTPVMARVVSGEFEGAIFIGGFKRMDEKLVLRFNKMVWEGKKSKNSSGKKQTWSVDGYAIDPEKYTPGVASTVDTHFMSRWGGLIAASFLEGFGEAKSRSGTRYYYGNDNNPGQFTNNYDLNDQAWIAAGKVGQRMANQIENNFNRPPTVTIHPGTPIGILVL